MRLHRPAKLRSLKIVCNLMTDFYVIWCADFKYGHHFFLSRKVFLQNEYEIGRNAYFTCILRGKTLLIKNYNTVLYLEFC